MSQPDIERLRALEKEWRKESDDFERDGDEDSASAYYNCAERLSDLIAELGQEVGAVASRPLHKVEPSDDEPQFRTLSNEVAPQVYFYRLGWNQCRDAMLLTSPAHTSEARDASGLVAAAKRLDKFSLVILSSVAVEDPEFSERVGAALVDLRNAAHADPCAVKYRKALERIFDCGRFPEGHHSAGDHEFCGSHHADCIAIAREALSEDAAMRQEGGNG